MRLIPRLSLFWRTLLLLLLLLALSLAVAIQSFRTFDLDPRARQLAQQIISIVNLTRTALIYADPVGRQALLAEFQENERVQVYPLELSDKLAPLPDDPFANRLAENIRGALGPETRVVDSVNGRPGVWISFTIDDDAYWLRVERERLERNAGMTWLAWGCGALLLALLGAVLTTQVVTRPLLDLTDAAGAVAAGKTPKELPETGTSEIALVNRSFNQMVASLQQVEDERRLMLAGVSHDLRTPITRIRLEMEMLDLPDDSRSGVEQDLAQMEAIVGQFIDLARPLAARLEPLDLNDLLDSLASHYRHDPRGSVQLTPPGTPHLVRGDMRALDRAMTNLIENGLRYGRTGDQPAIVTVSIEAPLQAKDHFCSIVVSDRGQGVPAEQLPALLQPFRRGESARSDVTGAGLGLAIVDRIARQHGGQLQLDSAPGQGFTATLLVPAA